MMKACTVQGCADKHNSLGYCNRHYLAFRKYGDPLAGKTIRPRGTGTMTNCGYLSKTVDGERKHEHVRIAEAALGGPLPPGAQVHHVDEDRTNNSPSNLVVCPDQAYHTLLHVRARAIEACGNPNFRRCWICKRYGNPASMGGNNGAVHHHECRRMRDAERKTQ